MASSPGEAAIASYAQVTKGQNMISDWNSTRRFLADDDGSTAVEYAVMVALIITTCIGAISALGGTSGGMWTDSLSTIEDEFAASKAASGSGS